MRAERQSNGIADSPERLSNGIADALERFDVIYFCGTEKWWDWEQGSFVSRPALIAKHLAGDPRVRELLVVDVPSSFVKAAVGGRRAPSSGLSTARPGVSVLDHVRVLPNDRHWPSAYRINGGLHDRRLRRDVSRAAERLGMTDPVVWLASPHVAKYAEWFLGSTVVYDAMDDWLEVPGQEKMREQLLVGYDTIRRRADLVFAVSAPLCEAFEGGRARVRRAPNGVDLSRFGRQGPEPGEIAAVPRPRVGYVGVLQDRIDVELVGRLADTMPDVHFVFIGPVRDAGHFAPLRSLPNVHMLGAKPADQVPSYLSAMDVCFLPHNDNPLTRSMDPLKLYEYLAAEKPVVVSDLPSIVQPPEIVRRASGAEAFTEALREVLDGRWRPDPDVRERYLRESSWEYRIDEMIGEVLGMRRGDQERNAPMESTMRESIAETRYAIVTPSRNEAAYIGDVARSLMAQTVLPTAWLVVDDGSTDGTGDVVREVAGEEPWVHILRRERVEGVRGSVGCSSAVNLGMRSLPEELDSYDFVVKLDADLILPPDYFERLFVEFERDPRLGMAGGHCYERTKNGLVMEPSPDDHVRGPTKVYRKECFAQVGPLIEAAGWDTVDELRAQMRGWNTRSFREPGVIHQKPMSCGSGSLMRGKFLAGRISHFLGYRSDYMLMRCLHNVIREPYVLGGAAMAYGYLSGVVLRKPMIDDPELRAHLRANQVSRLRRTLDRRRTDPGGANA